MPEEKTTQKEVSNIALEFSPQDLDAFIRKTTQKLEEKIRELDNQKKELEERVKEKTAEVEKRVKDLEDSRKALINLLEDIEEARKEAEKERDRTVSIINGLVDGLIILDSNQKVEFLNPAAINFLKIKEEDIKGKGFASLKEIESLKGLVDLVLKENEIAKIDREEYSPSKDLTLEVTTISLGQEKEKLGHIIVLHDITREKMVEKLKTEFVSVAAHQLRTPLAAIRWSLSLLKEENLTEEDKKDLIEKCTQSNDRMINLVNDLLNVTRIEEGRYVYELEPKDIIEIAKSSIAAAMEEAKKKKIDFSLILPKEKLPLLEVDEEKISLAIQNLVENAVHYTLPGGIVLFKIEYNKEKGEVLFTVKDTGVGIPKDQQKRIFTKFFRAENVMRMETEGSGLGLFITKNIIESHKGKIWFESEENKGTTFYFTLPVPQKEKFATFLERF